MNHSFFRWAIALSSLLVSIAIWIGVSSIAANAIHVLAKSSFEFRAFGSVSATVLVITICWAIAVNLWVIKSGGVPRKSVIVGVLAEAGWVIVIFVAAAIGDEVLYGLGPWAAAIWVVEAVVAAVLLTWCFALSANLWQKTQAAVAACALLAAIEVLLLGISPGVAIRM